MSRTARKDPVTNRHPSHWTHLVVVPVEQVEGEGQDVLEAIMQDAIAEAKAAAAHGHYEPSGDVTVSVRDWHQGSDPGGGDSFPVTKGDDLHNAYAISVVFPIDRML